MWCAAGLVFCLAGGSRGILQADPAAIVAWGNNPRLQAGTNAPNSFWVSTILEGSLSEATLAAGLGYGLVLKPDGTVFRWGVNRSGQATAASDSTSGISGELVKIGSEPLSNVMEIAAGARFSLALKSNGTVVAWGSNESGQAAVPANLSNVIAIAAGTTHAIALKQDGTVVNWGASRLEPPKEATNIVSIAAGGSLNYESNLALTSDGTVVGWGRPSPHGLSNVTAIATSEFHSLALLRDGTVYGWGDNDFGEATGTPTKAKPRYANGLVTLSGQVLSDVVAIAAGSEHGWFGTFCRYSLALKRDGTVVAWGVMNGKPVTVPEGLSNVVAIAAGHNFCLAVTTNAAVAERFRR